MPLWIIGIVLLATAGLFVKYGTKQESSWSGGYNPVLSGIAAVVMATGGAALLLIDGASYVIT